MLRQTLVYAALVRPEDWLTITILLSSAFSTTLHSQLPRLFAYILQVSTDVVRIVVHEGSITILVGIPLSSVRLGGVIGAS